MIKIILPLLFISAAFIVAYSGLFEYDRIGGTELDGNGCVCHTVERDTTVKVWVTGPDTLSVGETGLYQMWLAGGPAEAGGYNVAGRYGIMTAIDSFSVWDYRDPNQLTQAFPLVFPSPQDTIYWSFEYTVTDTAEIDTIYSCGLSIVYDSIPDEFDRWNFGAKFPVVVKKNLTVISDDINEKFPAEIVLFQNYPNPFNPATKIRWQTRAGAHQSLRIYDISGNEVAVLVDEYKPAGIYEVEFNHHSVNKDLASGIYFYQLRAGSYTETKKFILIK